MPAIPRSYVAAFRLLIAAAAVTGITIECAHFPPLRVFTYFTVLTNAAIALTFAWSAYRTWTRRPPIPPLIHGAVLLCIVITGLVYHLVLANDASDFSESEALGARTGALAFSNQLLHTVTPLTVVLDWLLLTAPGRFPWRYAGQWLLLPLAYFAFALIRGPFSGYPYPFLDVDTRGYPATLLTALLLALAFAALSLLLILLDHHRPSPRRNRISPSAPRPLK
ncbi:Pr6Pr family membrane protein [Streptomyces sp. NPDC008317]|uniref:Pr6Pr family membrane protein n=1 Tax=Streptomyces sp. NPDC008317 TaxID=3364827 RepID=UPI0036E9AC39